MNPNYAHTAGGGEVANQAPQPSLSNNNADDYNLQPHVLKNKISGAAGKYGLPNQPIQNSLTDTHIKRNPIGLGVNGGIGN